MSSRAKKQQHMAAARMQFQLGNQATTTAESATGDTSLHQISKAMTFYAVATGEMLQALMVRLERLHEKVDAIEKRLK